MSKGWRWAGLGLLFVGVLVGWQFRRPTKPSGDDATLPLARPLAASGASAAREGPVARQRSDLGTPSKPANERAQLKLRMKADWCGFGAAEYGRQSNAITEQASANGNGMVGLEVIEQLKLTAGQEVVDEAIEQVRRRWVKALMQRGDPRSRAVAEFLGGEGEDAARARVRLQALALTSSDPMVTALALQRPCDAGDCRNIEASQWSRLEPANLQAWLTLLRDARGGARSSQSAYVLERMATEGRYSRTYEREYKAMLLSLPQTETPGLMNAAEMQFISGSAAAWAIPSYKPLTEACQAGPAGSLQRCEAVFERLWEGDNQIDRLVALGMARRLVLRAYPEQKARWEPRAREYEALSFWISQVAAQDPPPGASPCDEQAELRKLIQGTANLGEWGHWRAAMRAAAADEAGLSAQWRREQGRSVLDPEPVPR